MPKSATTKATKQSLNAKSPSRPGDRGARPPKARENPGAGIKGSKGATGDIHAKRVNPGGAKKNASK